MRTVHRVPALGLAAAVLLLLGLSSIGHLHVLGLAVALVWSVVVTVALSRGVERRPYLSGLGPADRVTLVRAVLVSGAAGLVADGLVHPRPGTALVWLAVPALALDAVDGWLARRTGTTSDLGARFDMEVDAFLILVLSVEVSQTLGWWVLAIGLARYALWGAGAVLPWLAMPVPYRYWRKVVAATQGIVLTVTAWGRLPVWLTTVAVLAALVLLTESFGRDVWWLWRRRRATREAARTQQRTRPSRSLSVALTGVSVVLVWSALAAPNELSRLTPSRFTRLPVEAIALAVLAVVLPVAWRRAVSVVVGVLLGAVAVLSILDVGFAAALGRPFDPLGDWGYFDSAAGLLAQSVGTTQARLVVLLALVVAVALLALTPLAVLRLARVVARHRRVTLRAAAALAVVWTVSAAVGLRLAPGTPLASAAASTLAYDHATRLASELRDEQTFRNEVANDPFVRVPHEQLLSALRGKDVVIVFVESYGRVAIDGSPAAAGVEATLDAGSTQLAAAGFSSRSAYLTSPTFGGISWLAHSTLQSGMWIDDQRRYDLLLSTDRLTLAQAFRRAGWRTVADVPANQQDWPQGRSFYGYQEVYGATDVGYAGPSFSYATMPDQYTLEAFRRLELVPRRRSPVMAEIDLVSSHTPWAPLPRVVDWASLGDGSVFDGMPARGDTPGDVWRDAGRIRTAYQQSVAYSLTSVIQFAQRAQDPNLVLVVLGDHQPATVVSGAGASHDVPVTILARDPSVTARIGDWGWTPGLRPADDAPVWGMDRFRDRFFRSFSSASP